MTMKEVNEVYGVDWDYGTPALKEIIALQAKIKKMPGHNKLAPPDSRTKNSDYDGVSLPLKDGSSISIVRSYHEPGRGYSGYTIEIGDATIRCPDHGFTVYYQSRIPVQLKIGTTVVEDKVSSRLIMRGLPLPEQKTVLDWVRESIKQRKLGESPFSTKPLPLGQEPKS